jgi:acetone carboxylase gamma subunit
MWELICPMVYLSRRIKANTGGAGRHRGGSSFESLLIVHGTAFWELQNLGATRILASGLFGGYPGSASYVHNIKGADLVERAGRGEAYPLCDGSFDEPALMEIQGERTYKQDNFTTLAPFAEGDLYLSVMKGAPGLGDPLLRSVEDVERDVAEGHLLPRFAESIYGVSDREGHRRRRLERGHPAREWWAAERERVLAGGFIDAVKVGYAESMKLSTRFAAEFRGFWDLPEDFVFEIQTPTVPADVREQPGKVTPEESADAYLASSSVAEVEPPRARGGTLDRETLGAMLEEKLTRREVKDIQSGYKDADRFDKWLAVLQERVPYDDPIVLPMGEGLNAVRRASDGEFAVRCDCGHDFCPPDRNWKMEALIFVRDDPETMGEIYPGFAGPDTEWSELRELYCPSCARQLEVEAVPPGYPVVHEFLPDIEGFYRGWLGREVP